MPRTVVGAGDEGEQATRPLSFLKLPWVGEKKQGVVNGGPEVLACA